MAQWIKTDGSTQEVEPANGKAFTLEELQAFVQGTGQNGWDSKTITMVTFPSGKILVANDNGKLIGLPYNREASLLWQEEFPIEDYPHNNDGILVGNVLVCTKEQAGFEEDEDE